MIKRSVELAAFELLYARERLASLTYADALRIFTALWREARSLNPSFSPDWQEDLAPDFAIARAVNGLSPNP